MRNATILLGPPGTGKTTTLIADIGEKLKTIPPELIGFTSYSRSACDEARSRAAAQHDLSASQLVWFRTLHSLCARLLGWDKDRWLTKEDMDAFRQQCGYRLSDDNRDHSGADIALDKAPQQAQDDGIRAAYEWYRNCRRNVRDRIYGCPFPVPHRFLVEYADRYERFKAEHDKKDYTDCLEGVLEEGLTLGLEHLYIDEAQDLSPLQAAVVEHLAQTAKAVTVAGDDDQAIYGFQGADSSWLLQLAETCPTTVLSRSWRLPVSVHSLSQTLIGTNLVRVPKSFSSTGREGQIEFDAALSVLSRLGDEPTLCLARGRRQVQPMVEELFAAGVPYYVARGNGRNPYGSEQKVAAVRLAHRLSQGEELYPEEVEKMVKYVRSQGADALLSRGDKKRIHNLPPYTHGLTELRKVSAGLEHLVEAILEHGPAVVLQLKTRPETRAYFARLLQRYGELPEPKVILGTWHWSKGRQAPHVVVMPDLPGPCWRELKGNQRQREAERRVAYVAITRSQQRLTILRPRTSKAFPFRRYL